MTLLASTKSRIFPLFFALSILTCSPFWAFEYFINQDGSAHVYSSKLMLEILRGNQDFSEVYALNSISVPNSTGHWLMVLFLIFFSPIIVTKIMVTMTFAGLAASVAWFRYRTVGENDLATGLLLGFVLSYNWLWMLGSYNFIIGVIVFVFAAGYFYQRRDDIDPWLYLWVSLLLALAFLSHIISFLILSGTICTLAVFSEKAKLKRTLIWTFAAFLPVLPLVVLYKILSQSGEPFDPAWRHLANPFSLTDWLVQISTADPFVLLSRKTFPFTSANSKFFALFSPLLWIIAAVVFLALATFYSGKFKELFSKSRLPFILLFVFAVLGALFAPDDFGLTNGSVLRERILLCGLIFFVPLFRLDDSFWLKKTAQICLILVIVFQTAVMWEYSFRVNREATEFLAAESAISANERLASVTIVEESLRFHSVVVPQMSNFFGFKENVVVWDNYEIGHYLFPVVAKNPQDKQFVFQLTTSNAFYLDQPTTSFEENLIDLNECLSANHEKIQKLIVWGRDARIEAVLNQWFESEPLFENGRVRVFRHR